MDKTIEKPKDLLDCYEINSSSFKIDKVKRRRDYIEFFSTWCFVDELQAYKQLKMIILKEQEKLNNKLEEVTSKIEELIK